MESKRGLLRFADGVDKLLLLLGTLGCIGDGSMSPLTMFVLSGLMNEYGGAGFALSMDVVDKVYIYICQVLIDEFADW
jgi:ATP-binding cassette subfamily B (MDR/TAP) protein 1